MKTKLELNLDITKLDVKFAANDVNFKLHELGKAYNRYYQSLYIDPDSPDIIQWKTGPISYDVIEDAKKELDLAFDTYREARRRYLEVKDENR